MVYFVHTFVAALFVFLSMILFLRGYRVLEYVEKARISMWLLIYGASGFYQQNVRITYVLGLNQWGEFNLLWFMA